MATDVSYYAKKSAQAQTTARRQPNNLSVLTLWPVFLVLPISEGLPTLGTALWTAAAFAVLLGHVALGRAARPSYPVLWSVAAYAAGLGALSSSANAIDIRGHLINAVPILLFLILGPYVLRYVAKSSPETVGKLVAGFLIGQAVSATSAVVQALGLSVLGYHVQLGRAPGLAGHPNTLGVMAGISIVVSIFLLSKGKGRRLPLVLVFLLNVGALLASGSVSALLACAVGVVIVFVAGRVPSRIPMLIAGGVALAFWGLTQLTAESGLLRGPVDRFKQVTGQTRETSTLDIRQNTYSFAWERIQKDPFFGAGLDNLSGATFNQITVTHNVLLRSWFQGGLGMGLAFALIYVVAAVVIVRAILHGTDAASAGVLAVIIAFSMTSAALQQGYFWLLMLGAWALIEPKLSSNPTGVDGASLLDIGARDRGAVRSGSR